MLRGCKAEHSGGLSWLRSVCVDESYMVQMDPPRHLQSIPRAAFHLSAQVHLSGCQRAGEDVNLRESGAHDPAGARRYMRLRFSSKRYDWTSTELRFIKLYIFHSSSADKFTLTQNGKIHNSDEAQQ